MKFSIKIDQATGQRYMAVSTKGRALLFNYETNKGTAFSNREREELDLEGLLPPQISNMKQQLDRTYENFSSKTTNLEKFIYLTALQDRNETLYYRLLLEHIEEMMPVVYTPVVGEACQKFSHIYRRGRGVYISYHDRGNIARILRNVGIENPSIIVVTDGERILGLGDQGAGGMGIPIGKLCLYTLCAGVSPYSTIPITLDVGTDNEERLEDPLYIGLRQKRIRGEAYQEFIDEFVGAVKEVFPYVCLQWEDFLKGNAIHQLNRFRDEICSFNDDIQGTAGVVLAGLYSALRITGKPMAEQRIVFAGAGASAQGISDLLVAALQEDGLSEQEAIERIWTVDSQGLCAKDREGLADFKLKFARATSEINGYACRDKSRISLEETLDNVKPTILIGTSGHAGTFTEAVVRKMAEFNERPIIFPLSNPTSKTEVIPSDALSWSGGRAIVATGSPFDPVEMNGKRFRIGQANNALIFPGVGLGVAVSRARRVTDGMFLDSAKAMAAMVTQKDLDESAVYPNLTYIRECSHSVACETIRRAVKEGHAEEAILEGLEETVRRAMWIPEYLPIRYEE
ncbi:MAG: NAD-dependent malic enzyme [Acidobacteria bacterium]|nr:NAD-dependent malic enzyme [Acidobacteriota bacterium]